MVNVKNIIVAIVLIAAVGSAGYLGYNSYVQQGQIDTLTTSLTTAQTAAALVPTGLSIDINVTEDETFNFSSIVTADGNFLAGNDELTLEVTNEGSVEATGLVLMSEDLPDDLDGLDEFSMYVTGAKKTYLVKEGEITNGLTLPDLSEDEGWVGTITITLEAETAEDTLSDAHLYKWDLEVSLDGTLVEDKEIIMRT